MRHYHGTLYLCFFLIGCLMMYPITTSAEKSLDDIEAEREDIKAELSDAEKKVADIIIEMEEIKQEIDELNSIMEANQEQLALTEEEIEDVQQEINELQKKIEERFDILQNRMKSYQESGGNVSFLDVLFEADSFNEFISRVTAISTITDADAKLIEKQERDQQKVETKKLELEQMKAELQEKQEKLKEQKDAKRAGNQELQRQKDNLNESVDKLEMKDDKLSNLQTKLTKQKASRVRFAENSGNGEFGWPTDDGYISSPMGQRWGKTHKGIDIARTNRSTTPPIYAAESGTVKVAGKINGYGKAIIIDHGKGLETLYGHMSELKVKSGQQVKRGQQIGVMGSTGQSTGIHLHFEVHKNGSIVNPIGYLND